MERPGSDPLIRGPERFDEFYRREFPKMVALASVVSGSRSVAEDIAQEAMVEAQRRWDTIGLYDKPGAWLRRVTIQKASKRLRRARLEAVSLLKLSATPPIPAGTDDVEEVFEAIRKLPPRQRAAITLHYLDGYAIAEVAEVLDCAPGTAKAHLFKARQGLARMLGEEFTT